MPDVLICLEDGKKFKSLRRHLKLHGLTLKQYREKWNLPPDYPMVAPNLRASCASSRTPLARKFAGTASPVAQMTRRMSKHWNQS